MWLELNTGTFLVTYWSGCQTPREGESFAEGYYETAASNDPIVFCRNFDPIKNKTLLIPIWFWCKRMSHFGDGGKITLGFIFCKNSYQVRIRADITKVGFPRRERIYR